MKHSCYNMMIKNDHEHDDYFDNDNNYVVLPKNS